MSEMAKAAIPDQESHSPDRMLILFSILPLTFMATLDGSIVNVALPTMARSLSTGTGAIAWVVTAYLLAIVSLILFFGKLGDVIGMSRVFLGGIGLFSIGSLLCGISFSFPALVASRVVQGVGAAAAMATNLAIIAKVFPPTERGKALGLVGSFVALGTLSGPPLGGFITDALSWPYIFLINVPIGLIAFFFGLRVLPKDAPDEPAGIDVPGALLFACATAALFGSIIIGGERGYRNAPVAAGFIVSAVSYAAFYFRERRTSAPLLDFSIFSNSLFVLSLFCGFLSFVSISASSIMLPFYLQNALRLSPSFAGLFMMAYPLVLAVVAPASGRLSDKIGSEILTLVGLTLGGVGLLLLSTVTEATPLKAVLGYVLATAVGNGMFQSPNTSLIMSSVPRKSLGVAGSLNGLARNFGMAFGISASISLLYILMSFKIGRPVFSYVEGRTDVFFFGMRGVYLAAALVSLFGSALTAYRLVSRKRRT